jgi:VWFA-related protein
MTVRGPQVPRLTRLLRIAVGAALATATTMAVVAHPVGRAFDATPQQAQEPAPQPDPRFRAGANLVRVDAYVMADGVAVTDLTVKEFEVLEDNVPQRVESFQLVQPRGAAPVSELREPNTVAESREMAKDPNARVFVLFMDFWHVQIEGSFHAQGPVTRLLNRVIGRDDLVGIMTPEMSARNLTLARRTETIEGLLKNNWFWGERNRINSPDPREEALKMCYPDIEGTETYGIARAMINRRRVGSTLNAIEDLIVHLEGIREERKFVVLLTEGWLLPRPDQRLSRPLGRDSGDKYGRAPGGPEPIGTDPAGRLRLDPRRDGRDSSLESCERERALLAFTDYETDFRDLLQRANRANVSFYPLDARGLVTFDEPIGPDKPPPPSVDAALLRDRQNAMHELAINTDGYAIVNTGNIDKALERMVQDAGAYYLLGYYSTNTRLDGRFRKLTVRVKRPNVEVRSRPGYQAPTEADMASARVDGLMKGAAPGYSTFPPGVARALEGLAPTRGVVPVRVQAAASAQQIWVTGELDATTAKAPEWQQGGSARLRFEHEQGGSAPFEADATIEPGQRSFSVTPPPGVSLAAGRYVVRVQVTAKGSVVPLQTTADVVVPAPTALVSQSGLVLRRGPQTGLNYSATADARFRRTERLRLEVPRVAGGGIVSARLLGRDGQPLPVLVTHSERVDASQQLAFIVLDLTLAPLAQGDYVVELTVEKDGKKEGVAYGFKLVP